MVLERMKFRRKGRLSIGKTEIIVIDNSKIPRKIRKPLNSVILKTFRKSIVDFPELHYFKKIKVILKDIADIDDVGDDYTGEIYSSSHKWFYHVFVDSKKIFGKFLKQELRTITYVNPLEQDSDISTIRIYSDNILYYGFIRDIFELYPKYFSVGSAVFEFKKPLEYKRNVARLIDKYFWNNRDNVKVKRNMINKAVNAIVSKLDDTTKIDEVYKDIKKTIMHELVHAVHKIVNKETQNDFAAAIREHNEKLRKYKDALKAIQSDLEKNPEEYIEEKKLFIERFYYALNIFAQQCLSEGIAELYSEEFHMRTDQAWLTSYSKAVEEAKILDKLTARFLLDLKGFINRKKIEHLQDLISELDEAMYIIGQHMAFTISFFPISQYTIKPNQFFEVYLQVCEKFNKRPAISITDEDAYFMIKGYLKKIDEIKKSI